MKRSKSQSEVSYCDFCDSTDVRPELVTMQLQRAGRTYTFENVPAEVCQQCGHHYYQGPVIQELDRRIDAGLAGRGRAAA